MGQRIYTNTDFILHIIILVQQSQCLTNKNVMDLNENVTDRPSLSAKTRICCPASWLSKNVSVPFTHRTHFCVVDDIVVDRDLNVKICMFSFCGLVVSKSFERFCLYFVKKG